MVRWVKVVKQHKHPGKKVLEVKWTAVTTVSNAALYIGKLQRE